ncbi:hypothetical protein C8F01DRAFT_32400 [Mycena amicta]|nr:hypothetical protein C8F01DRAFT_32400 [Mycena amicta]
MSNTDWSLISATDLALLLPTLPLQPYDHALQQLSVRIIALLGEESTTKALFDAIHSLLSTVTPTSTTEDVGRVAFLLHNVLSDLPRQLIEPFRDTLTRISACNLDLQFTSRAADDIIRFLNTPHAYVPVHKTDDLGVRSIAEGVHTADQMRPLIPGLLSWLQDRNWPMVRGSCEQLARFPALAVKGIRSVLQHLNGDDGEWEGNLLHFVRLNVPSKMRRPLRPDLERIVQRPTDSELENEVVEVAMELLMDMDDWAERSKVRLSLPVSNSTDFD